MKIILKAMKNTLLSLGLVLTIAPIYAEDGKVDLGEEVERYSEESSKLRAEHIQELRGLHLKYVNELYDRRLKHNSEMSEYMKQNKPTDKEGFKEMMATLKDKGRAFREEEKKFKKDFYKNVLKDNSDDFREARRERRKELTGKFKKHLK